MLELNHYIFVIAVFLPVLSLPWESASHACVLTSKAANLEKTIFS